MNRLKAKIVSKISHEGACRVEAISGGYRFGLLLLGQPDGGEGKETYLLIKESEIAISKTDRDDISISNRIECTVTNVKMGKILCEISLSFADETLTSIITADSTARLCIQKGDIVYALIKANEIYLENV